MNQARPYRQTTRAESAERTRRSLVMAMQALFAERPYEDITLDAVAERAGVTLQTLLRRFGSKAGLLAAAAADAFAQVEAQRGQAPPGELRACVKNLFDHYEQWGRVSLRLLAQEESLPEIAELTRWARQTHVDWVEQVFSRTLAGRRGTLRRIRHAQLVALCDVYVWKLLRLDIRLSRGDAEKAVLGMLEPLTERRKD